MTIIKIRRQGRTDTISVPNNLKKSGTDKTESNIAGKTYVSKKTNRNITSRTLKYAHGTLHIIFRFIPLERKLRKKYTLTVEGQSTTTSNETVAGDWRKLQLRAKQNAEYKYIEVTGIASKRYAIQQIDYYIIYLEEGKGNTILNKKMMNQAYDVDVEFKESRKEKINKITRKYKKQEESKKQTFKKSKKAKRVQKRKSVKHK